MADKKRAIVSLLLLGLVGLLGCHQDEPEAVELAKREHFHAKQLFTDRASLLYAQQELGLADAKGAKPRSVGLPADEEAKQAANHHLQQARLQLKIDADYRQLDEDQEKLSSFARMLTGPQSHEDHP